jgi:hypothetical protein
MSTERVDERFRKHSVHLGGGKGASVLSRLVERVKVRCEIPLYRVRCFGPEYVSASSHDRR